MSTQNRLLVIDDEPAIRSFFRDVAEDMDYVVAEAERQEEFVAAYDTFQPTAIILDLTMPHMDGIEILRDLAERKCTAPVLLASGQDTRVLNTAQRIGRNLGLKMPDGLQKPINVPDLEQALDAAFIASSVAATVSTTAVQHALEKNDITVADLDRAIGAGEIILHYQPKNDLQQGDRFPVIGCEALARWMHPERGLISPALFIPMAEANGLIEQITETVLHQAVDQLVEWRKQGLRIPISVNLSPKQLTDLELPDRIAAMLTERSLDPELLVLEITEQSVMADVNKATDILTRLRLKKISVSLDDFGAGYSSLVEMYRMPLSELKLDRSLIMDVDHDEDARIVVGALVKLAQALNLPVCAEGAETKQSVRFLQSVGCDKVQGFYFSRPLPVKDFLMFVNEQATDD